MTRFKNGWFESRSAYSLIELLAVISIIVVVAGFATFGLQGRDGLALRSAQEILLTQVQAARNVAIAQNTTCRLLVDAGTDAVKGRRALALAVKPASGNSWELTGVVTMLRDNSAVLVDDGEIPSTTQGGSTSAPLKMTLNEREWYYFEFDPSGTSEENAGAILLVGIVQHDGSKWIRKKPDLIRGVMIRRSGLASAFSDPDHIRAAYNAQ